MYDINRIILRLAKDKDETYSAEQIANFVKEKIEEYFTINFSIDVYRTAIDDSTKKDLTEDLQDLTSQLQGNKILVEDAIETIHSLSKYYKNKT